MTTEKDMEEITSKKISKFTIFLAAFFAGLSFLCSFLIAFSFYELPSYYDMLYLLPLTFGFCCIVFFPVFMKVIDNFGILLIIALFFVRMCVSPALISICGIDETIKINLDENTKQAILLVCYECIVIFATIAILVLKDKNKNKKLIFSLNENKERNRVYLFLFVSFAALIIMYILEPHIFDVYRTIFSITDPNFSSIENSYIIDKYGTTFVKKFVLVSSNYLIKVLRIVVPCVIMERLSKSKRIYLSRFISLLCVMSSFLVVDGAIARSLYYAVILVFVYIYLFSPKHAMWKILGLFMCGAVLVLTYWVLRYSTSAEKSIKGFFDYFSRALSSYFSGVNVVSGSFNLIRDIKTQLHYFIYDYAKSVPFGNTLFGLTGGELSVWFNEINNSSGQIPSTIGTGYYYFGPVLAPLYSCIFTIIAYKASANSYKTSKALYIATYMLTAFYCALGIIMYNMPITIGNLFQIIIPMFIVARIVYGKASCKEGEANGKDNTLLLVR